MFQFPNKIDDSQIIDEDTIASIKKQAEEIGSTISNFFGQVGKEALDLGTKAGQEISDFVNTTSSNILKIFSIK